MSDELKYNDSDDELPDLQSYLRDLQSLSNYDFTGLSKEQIYNIYYDFARTIPASYSSMEPSVFNSIDFYRVRLNIDRSKEDITLAQTYSFPPPVFCTENGRANVEGKSVFYCSHNLKTAIREVKPKIGDEVFLSVWKGRASRKLKIGQCLPPKLPKSNGWGEMAENSFNTLIRVTKSEEKRDQLEELYKFIANKFRTEKNPYHLTSMISWELLYGQLWRDFIIYPSVLDEGLSCNMAFHPNSVSENLKFEKLIKFKIVDYINDQIVFNLGTKVGYLENTKMKWRDRSKEETNLFK